MASVQLSEDGTLHPAVTLPVFEGPLDLLLHLVRANKVSIWDIPVAKICKQYQQTLRAMEALDLDVAGEYLVCAAWLLAIKSRMLLPRRPGADGEDADDPRRELVERLIEYEKVKAAASELAGISEIRRGVMSVRFADPELADEPGVDLSEVDVVALGQALRAVLERHRRDHPEPIEVPPLRFSVREKIVELFALVGARKSFPFLSHLLTRPDRVEGVTLLVAALELVRLGNVALHQRDPFAEIFLTATGKPLSVEDLIDG